MVREASGFTDLLDRSSGGCGVGGRMVMDPERGGGEREEGNEEEETSGHGHGHGHMRSSN